MNNVKRFSSEGMSSVDVRGMLSGSTAFLVGGSPSLLKQDTSVFGKPGAIVVGMNNVGKVIKTDMDVFADLPQCYYPSVLSNPASMKFAKLAYASVALSSYAQWKDMPNTYFYEFKDGEPREAGDVLISRNNCLAISIELLSAMGVRRIVLCGCDFDAGGYSDGRADLSKRHIEWNRHLYYEQVQWLGDMIGSLASKGISLADASAYSKAGFYKTIARDGHGEAMVKTTLEEEAKFLDESRRKEDSERNIVHCIDLYSFEETEERLEKMRSRNGDFAPYHTPVVSCLALNQSHDMVGSTYNYESLFLLCLCFLHSLAKSNPGRKVYMFVEGETERQLDMMRKSGKGLDLHFVTLKKETKDLIPAQGLRGWSTNLRCALPKILNEYNCFWLDCDTLVFGNLDELEDEADKAYEKSGDHNFFQGVRDFGYTRNKPLFKYVNAGVLFMRLSAIRAARKEDDLIKVCEYWSRPGAFGNEASDQHVISSFGADYVPDCWNVMELTVDKGLSSKPDELKYNGKIYHFIGEKYNLMYRRNNMTSLLFDEMSEVYKALGDGIFDFKGGTQWKNEMLTR